MVGIFECIFHLWLARASYALSSSIRWEQDGYALWLELLKSVLQLFTGWCLAGCVAATTAVVSILKVGVASFVYTFVKSHVKAAGPKQHLSGQSLSVPLSNLHSQLADLLLTPQIRLFARYEVIDTAIQFILAASAFLTSLAPDWRSSAVGLMCTQAQQLDSGWRMSRWAAEDCAESLQGDWSWLLPLLCGMLLFKIHCSAVVSPSPSLFLSPRQMTE